MHNKLPIFDKFRSVWVKNQSFLYKTNKSMIVRFLKTGDLYKVLEENSEMKHPESREWISSVIYQSYKKLVDGEYIEVTEPKTYVREKAEFLERFLPVFDF